MKTLVLALLLLLASCASKPAKDESPWMAYHDAFQRQRQTADSLARQTGDERPYPEGWVGLPRKRDPKIAESIRLGQTMAEVAAIMGREGGSHKMGRHEFLQKLKGTYGNRSSHKLPRELGRLEERLPAAGRFVEWQYQGFPSTGDWVVVFFAPTQDEPDSEPRVIARGVFRLGCFF